MKLIGTSEGVELRVRVQPRTSRSGIVGVRGNALRVRLTAPPVEGAANRELRKLLASTLGVARSRVEIVRGEHSRAKLLLLRGLTPLEVKARLDL